MPKSMSNNVLLAKARAMYGKRLTQKDFSELLRKESVSEITAYLKTETYFSQALEGVHARSIHRGQLENLLKRQLFERYTKFLRFVNGKGNEFFNYITYKSDIDQILDCIRLLNAGKPQQYIVELPAFLMSHASFDLMKLAEVTNFDELLRVLEHTPYKEALKPFRPENPEEHIPYSDCEVALYTQYFQRCFQIIRKEYKGKARKELMNIFSFQAEMSNITRLIRMKTYFHKDEAFIRRHLLPISYRISGKMMESLIKAESAAEVVGILQRTKYGKQLTGFHEPVDFIEHYTYRIEFDSIKRLMRYSRNPSVVVAAYLFVSDIEIKNIIYIIEGIRYQAPAEDIRQMLIYS